MTSQVERSSKPSNEHDNDAKNDDLSHQGSLVMKGLIDDDVDERHVPSPPNPSITPVGFGKPTAVATATIGAVASLGRLSTHAVPLMGEPHGPVGGASSAWPSHVSSPVVSTSNLPYWPRPSVEASPSFGKATVSSPWTDHSRQKSTSPPTLGHSDVSVFPSSSRTPPSIVTALTPGASGGGGVSAPPPGFGMGGAVSSPIFPQSPFSRMTHGGDESWRVVGSPTTKFAPPGSPIDPDVYHHHPSHPHNPHFRTRAASYANPERHVDYSSSRFFPSSMSSAMDPQPSHRSVSGPFGTAAPPPGMIPAYTGNQGAGSIPKVGALGLQWQQGWHHGSNTDSAAAANGKQASARSVPTSGALFQQQPSLGTSAPMPDEFSLDNKPRSLSLASAQHQQMAHAMRPLYQRGNGLRESPVREAASHSLFSLQEEDATSSALSLGRVAGSPTLGDQRPQPPQRLRTLSAMGSMGQRPQAVRHPSPPSLRPGSQSPPRQEPPNTAGMTATTSATTPVAPPPATAPPKRTRFSVSTHVNAPVRGSSHSASKTYYTAAQTNPRRHSETDGLPFGRPSMEQLAQEVDGLALNADGEPSYPMFENIDDYFSPDSRNRTMEDTSPPYDAASHRGPLFVVEFKSGRSDIFFVPEDADHLPLVPISIGNLVIVEADRGKDLGKVTAETTYDRVVRLSATNHAASSPDHPPQNDTSSPTLGAGKDLVPKRIYRVAQSIDISQLQAKAQDEAKAMVICQAKVRQKKLPMEVVDAEYQWDRRKLTFYFVAERRIDFRELVRDLFKIYKTRIWMCAVDKSRSFSNISRSRS